jgi:formylglycine-generating enzyme required for sulfatase activity
MKPILQTTGLYLLLNLIFLQGMFAQTQSSEFKAIPIKSPTPYSAKYALIIGNYSYKNGWVLLPSVKAEIRTVDSALAAVGFINTIAENLTREQLIQTLKDFIQKYDRDKLNGLLIYYSGQSFSLDLPGNKLSGCLIPIDAPTPDQAASYPGKLFSMTELMQLFRPVTAYHCMFIFNACFDESLFTGSEVLTYANMANIKKPVKQYILASQHCDSIHDRRLFSSLFVSGLLGKADHLSDSRLTGSEMGEYLSDPLKNGHLSYNPTFGIIGSDTVAHGNFMFCEMLHGIGNDPASQPITIPEVEVRIITNYNGLLSIDGIGSQSVKKDIVTIIPQVSIGPHSFAIDGVHKWDSIINIEENNQTTIDARIKFNDFFEMVYVLGGGFQMGSNYSSGNESPIHNVYLDNYYIGKYEVTQKQWQDVMGAGDRIALFHHKCDSCPVENVTYSDIQLFISKLNAKTGLNYRLPTEAEWEYAAFGGKQRRSPDNYKYSGGDNLNDVAWFNIQKNKYAQPVGKKKPNTLDIYDMTGNVWEYCSDYYSENYYSHSAEKNPLGPQTNKDDMRILRGGAWTTYDVNMMRVTVRKPQKSVIPGKDIGFRIARY